jgi:hypothetical protein
VQGVRRDGEVEVRTRDVLEWATTRAAFAGEDHDAWRRLLRLARIGAIAVDEYRRSDGNVERAVGEALNEEAGRG